MLEMEETETEKMRRAVYRNFTISGVLVGFVEISGAFSSLFI